MATINIAFPHKMMTAVFVAIIYVYGRSGIAAFTGSLKCCLSYVCIAELNPPTTRSHRSLFNFQVTHVGYGETWKEKDVVEAYSMKRSHPNYALPGATIFKIGKPQKKKCILHLCYSRPFDTTIF